MSAGSSGNGKRPINPPGGDSALAAFLGCSLKTACKLIQPMRPDGIAYEVLAGIGAKAELLGPGGSNGMDGGAQRGGTLSSCSSSLKGRRLENAVFI